MAATSQPISIARDQHQRSSAPSHFHSPSLTNNSSTLHPSFAGSPMHTSSSSLLAQPPHLANPRWAGTSPRSAESSTSWAIHPGPLFVTAGSLGSTSGSLGANSISGSAGSFRARMYSGVASSPAAAPPLLNPLDPEFKFRGVVGSMESDHSSLINAHMSEREVEQCRNFTCCGLPLHDLHALVEHFEDHHILVVDPLQPLPQMHPQCAFPFSAISGAPLDLPGPLQNAGSENVGVPTRSTDSSLAGALGPSTSQAPLGRPSNGDANVNGMAAAAAFDLDDMDLDMEMEPEPEQATSPAPSASSSSNSNNSNSISSNRSSPLSGGAGPLPLTQPQRFAANGNMRMTNGTRSSLSSPPDTPLLTTPVSPFATAPTTSQATFPWQGQGQQDGLAATLGASQASSNNMHVQGQNQAQGQQAPLGPSAFDNVHLPAKQHIPGPGMFAHPYAGASSARRHPHPHPLSPLSSSGSTSGATSPASASSASTFGFGAMGLNGQGQALQQGGHGLHHTQSLYALRLARHRSAEREYEREELLARAMNGYAGYEDYSRGFPGTADVGIAGAGIAMDGAVAAEMGMGRMNVNVGPTESAIHPGLLFGNAGRMNGAGQGQGQQVKCEPNTNAKVFSARTTPAPSRSGSPQSSASSVFASSTSTSGPSSSSTPLSTPGSSGTSAVRKAPTASTTLSRPSSSLLLSKPFKCPTPGCTKSYKQANGLKYHVTHGQCSFTPPPELSSISELGLSIGVNLKLGPMGLEGLEGMSEKERRDAEREAERRLRPFCCQVKPCTRRYKNMNGLRYHYQHSGEHGAIGLRMLASGRHDATRSQSVERSEGEEEMLGALGAGASASASMSSIAMGGEEGEGERGRRRERERLREGGGQTSSAPSTPGPSATTFRNGNSNGSTGSPFTTQTFAFPGLHQRSLSGSGAVQQPRSPLSQQFPASSSSSYLAQNQNQNQNAPHQAQNQNANQNQNQNANARGGGGGQYAFAVQSQPASAYASPWGSRAGSPTEVAAGVGVGF